MSSDFDGWAIVDDSTGHRSTDDPFWPWAQGEVIAVLPADATSAERTAAVQALAQAYHFHGQDRSDILQFLDRSSYLAGAGDYFDALHPYLSVVRAKNIRHVAAPSPEARGQIEFDRA
jgi:hypothetical protein